MRSSIKGVLPEWYTLIIDKDEPEPVQFHLKPLDQFDSAGIKMQSLSARSSASNLETIGSEIVKTAFRRGVIDWRNIEDGDNPGQALEFSQAAMGKIPSDWIIEAGARVLEISALTEDESKNSDLPSPSPKT